MNGFDPIGYNKQKCLEHKRILSEHTGCKIEDIIVLDGVYEPDFLNYYVDEKYINVIEDDTTFSFNPFFEREKLKKYNRPLPCSVNIDNRIGDIYILTLHDFDDIKVLRARYNAYAGGGGFGDKAISIGYKTHWLLESKHLDALWSFVLVGRSILKKFLLLKWRQNNSRLMILCVKRKLKMILYIQ